MIVIGVEEVARTEAVDCLVHPPVEAAPRELGPASSPISVTDLILVEPYLDTVDRVSLPVSP